MGLRTRTPSTRDRPPRRAGVLQRYLGTDIAIAVAAVAVGLAGVLAIPRSPDTVSRLTISNPSAYDMEIALTGPNGGELALGTVDVHSTRDFNQVLDQGDTWTFHFHAQGVDAGAMTVPSSELASAGWKMTIPNDAIGRLAASATPLSPCTTDGCAPTP